MRHSLSCVLSVTNLSGAKIKRTFIFDGMIVTELPSWLNPFKSDLRELSNDDIVFSLST